MDYQSWFVNDKESNYKSWRDKYIDYHTRGWQFDPKQKHTRIELANNNFTATLSAGRSYHGLRASHGVDSGIHYFEVMVEPVEEHEEENLLFDKGTNIYLGVGIANDTFNCENCTSGWTAQNSGVGYYNDGQIYALGERYYDSFNKAKKIESRSGDRVGFELNLDPNRNGTITFFLNGKQITEPIGGIHGKLYPHLILAKDVKLKMTIISRRRGFPKTPPRVSFTRGVFVMRLKVNFPITVDDKIKMAELAESAGKKVYPNYEVMVEMQELPKQNLFFRGSCDPAIQVEIKTAAINASPSPDCSKIVSLMWFSGLKAMFGLNWSRVVWCESQIEEGPVRMWFHEPKPLVEGEDN